MDAYKSVETPLRYGLSFTHGWLNTKPDHLQACLKALNSEKNDAYGFEKILDKDSLHLV